MDTIAVIDFGSQYAQLITRRVREAQVYSELFPWNASQERVLASRPKGFILSGGPASVYDRDAPTIPPYILESQLPVLGICYGMQLLTSALGGHVAASTKREYGSAEVEVLPPNPLLPAGKRWVWMSHGDRIEKLPDGFISLAHSPNSPMAAMGELKKRYFGVQFHPEVRHTQSGNEILRRFAIDVCGARPQWTPESIISETIRRMLDLHMPGMTGFDVLERLRSETSNLPVIVITGHDEPGTPQRVRALAAADYLLKPVDETALLTAIKRSLTLALTTDFSPKQDNEPTLE